MADKPKSYVKGGYFYRQKEGGGRVLRIRKKGEKPKPTAPKPTLSQRVKKDPNLLQKYLGDPALRSKLDDSFLPPDLLNARRQRQLGEDISDPTTPLSGPTMVRTATTLVDNQINPQVQGLDREDRQVQGQSAQQQTWNRAYNQDIASTFDRGITAQGTQNQQAVQGANDQTAATIAAIANAAAQAQQRNTADADIRGQGLDGGTAGTIATQQAADAGLAAQQGGTFAGMARQTGDTASAFLRGLQGIQGLRTQEQNSAIGLNERNRLAENSQKRTDLQSTRADKITEILLGMRGDEVANYFTARQLGSKEDQAALDAIADANKQATATAPDGVHTMREWLNASPAQRTAWTREAAAAKRAPTTPKSPKDPKLAPDKVHTMDEWLAASPATRRKWLRQAGKKDTSKDGTGTGKIQAAFDQGYASLANRVSAVPLKKGVSKKLSQMTPEERKRYVSANRDALIQELVAAGRSKGVTPEIARRIVRAYYLKAGGNPGSFKDYKDK